MEHIPGKAGQHGVSSPHFQCLIENEIIRCRYRKGLIVDNTIALQMIVSRLHLSEGRVLPALADARGCSYILMGAKKLLAGSVAFQHVSALAILVDSHVMKVIFTTLIKLKKSDVPVQLFTDEQKALDWLRKYKRHEGGRADVRSSLLIL